MTKMFKEIEETTDFSLRVAVSLAGGSGTGKTYSACLLARGLAGGEHFAFLDTENRRALHYRNDFPEMRHFNFGPEVDGELVGFSPERWISALDQLGKVGVKAVVIDSFSHAWEGIGGVLELQADICEKMSGGDANKADRVGQLAWAQVKPRYRRLIEAIVQAPFHIILCVRAKPVLQSGFGANAKNARATKIRRLDLPWDVATDRDLVFEMTCSALFEPERPGQPLLLKCPDHFRSLFSGSGRVSVEMGEKMAQWASDGGIDRTAKELLDSARVEARKGVQTFREFYVSLDSQQKETVMTIKSELQQTAMDADARRDGDFFDDAQTDTAPAQDAIPTQEQLNAAEAEALAEIEALHGAQNG